MSNKKFGIRYNTRSYIEKAREIHQGMYDYSLVDYKNSFTKIEIGCPIHGIFTQRACDHINQKQGCPKCSHNFPYTHTDFVKKSQEKYNNKFKIISDYKGMKHSITIQCIDHSIFTLKMAEKHLERNGGCPICWRNGRLGNLKPGNISKLETKWLDSLNVPLRQHKLIIEGKTFLVDGFDPQSNTVYEFYGSFWHGNPVRYNLNDMNTVVGKTFGQLYNDTLTKEKILKLKHHLVTKWD